MKLTRRDFIKNNAIAATAAAAGVTLPGVKSAVAAVDELPSEEEIPRDVGVVQKEPDDQQVRAKVPDHVIVECRFVRRGIASQAETVDFVLLA